MTTTGLVMSEGWARSVPSSYVRLYFTEQKPASSLLLCLQLDQLIGEKFSAKSLPRPVLGDAKIDRDRLYRILSGYNWSLLSRVCPGTESEGRLFPEILSRCIVVYGRERIESVPFDTSLG
jgi:hypothetical protein